MTLAELSPRQREVAALVGAGKSVRFIARALGNRSTRTVRVHIATIADKIGREPDVGCYATVMRWMLGGDVPRRATIQNG